MELSAIVLVPGDATANVVTSSGTVVTPIRVVRRYDDFAAALQTHTTALVRVDDQPYLPAPSEGTILVCPPDVLQWSLTRQLDNPSALTERTVLVDIVRTYALDWAEKLGLAAAIETSQYLAWQRGSGPGSSSALYGRKDVGVRLGATWSDLPSLQSDRYALLSHPDYPDLPALLVAYLQEYARDLT